jgi:hypothetical protein
LWNALVQSKTAQVADTPKPCYDCRKTAGSIVNDSTLVGKLGRINSYIVLIKKLWQMADINTGEVSSHTEGWRIMKVGFFLPALRGLVLLESAPPSCGNICIQNSSLGFFVRVK